jgi:phosphotriesterase-related protein
MSQLITTLGRLNATDVGMILPHEHVFVDLRTWDQPGYGQADPEDVVKLMQPEIEKARAVGVTAIVECSTGGVGRRADVDMAVSKATDFPLVVPTGVYREPWVPQWVHQASEGKLREWMLSELEGQIDDSGVQAAWIKLSAGDDGITDVEVKILKAASAAAAATNAVIGSHTIRGDVVRRQLEIIEQGGYSPQRFIWIHTQAEPDFEVHLEMARRGVWLEYDGIGGEEPDDDTYIDRILRLLDAGYAKQLMLSHDRGWYDPAQPGGGVPRPYTYISEVFLPRLRARGADEALVKQLTCDNPFKAFSR